MTRELLAGCAWSQSEGAKLSEHHPARSECERGDRHARNVQSSAVALWRTQVMLPDPANQQLVGAKIPGAGRGQGQKQQHFSVSSCLVVLHPACGTARYFRFKYHSVMAAALAGHFLDLVAKFQTD